MKRSLGSAKRKSPHRLIERDVQLLRSTLESMLTIAGAKKRDFAHSFEEESRSVIGNYPV
jgi:hypothetical protein